MLEVTGDMNLAVKIATLEADMKHLTAAVEKLTTQVEMLNALMERSRGVIWVFTVVSGVIGFLLTKLFSVIPWAALVPR